MPKISLEEILFLVTSLSFLPIIIPVFTPYLKYSLIFGIIKAGMNNPSLPSSMLIAILSLILTYNEILPVINLTISKYQQLPKNMKIGEQFLALKEPAENWIKTEVTGVSHSNLFCAYIFEQINRGLQYGFKILVVFLVIDLLVAITLACLGLQMLSPQGISLAIKLFVIIQSELFTKIIYNLSNGRVF